MEITQQKIYIPSEIIIYILKFLNSSQRNLVTKTCSELRNIIIEKIIKTHLKLNIGEIIISDNINLLKWCLYQGCPRSIICYFAASKDYINCLIYAHKKGYYWDIYTCYIAAKHGYLNCLKYACENGCEINDKSYEILIKDHNLECLKYLYENRDTKLYSNNFFNKTNKALCAISALAGNIECLKYFHTIGYEWDENTCKNAVKNNHLECLIYAYENGCPIGNYTDYFGYNNNCSEYIKRLFYKNKIIYI